MKAKQQYLVTLPPEQSPERLTEALRPLEATAQWIAVDPNQLYDHEFTFTTEAIFDRLAIAINETLQDLDLKLVPDLSRLSREQIRRIVELAVTRWGYLGPSGIEVESIAADWRNGRIAAVLEPAP